ncbi:hypothetical protein BS17DRAFT_191084 [Gyrodon lividus]|nr:hypothetical protein BS17DRAFT_191084 [Gyrodon lividus]
MTTHTVNMTNNCGFGVATLDQVPSITLATGSQSYTNATVNAGAFLNTDVSMNDTISIVVVDLIPTHVFTVPVGFTFFNGCDGAGVSCRCLSSDCVNAIRDPSQNSGMVTCSMAGAGVLVTFCPDLEATTSSTAPSTSSSSVVPTSTPAPSSSNAAVIGGVVGGVVGALVILLIAGIVYFRRRRRRPSLGEVHAIEEFRVPAPYSAIQPNPHDDNPVMLSLSKRGPYGSLQNITPPILTPIDYSGTISSTSQQSARLRPLPIPPRSPNSTAPSAPASDVGGSPRRADLDRIIEGLAERFGWTAPPPGVDSLPPPGRSDFELPEYR